jgi:hypothetical protein
MDPTRKFLLGFCGPVVALFLCLLAASLGLNLQPLEGDLTRLGGYSSNDFGFTAAKEASAELHTDFGTRYDRPYDVLVIGDSFSQGTRKALWQNYFYQSTGLSMLTLQLSDLGSFEALTGSQMFREHPPKLVVFEIAEFQLLGIWGYMPGMPTSMTRASRQGEVRIEARPQKLTTTLWTRLDGLAPLHIDFGVTQNYLHKNFLRDVLGINGTAVTAMPLTRSNLFSNRRGDTLLVLDKHTAKRAWRREQVRLASQHVAYVQALCEANGRTAFEFMLAPDRETLYAPFVSGARLEGLSKLSWFYAYPGLHAPRVDLALARLIDEGAVDVYMPDDTHWSYLGYREAARTLEGDLKARGILVPATPSASGAHARAN